MTDENIYKRISPGLMKHYYKQLVDNAEPPIYCERKYAKTFGINEGIFLSILGRYCKPNAKGGKVINGKRWVFNTYQQWQENHMDWLGVQAIQRIALKLEKEGYVESCQPDGFNKKKYYRPNEDKVMYAVSEMFPDLYPDDNHFRFIDDIESDMMDNIDSDMMDNIKNDMFINSITNNNNNPVIKRLKDTPATKVAGGNGHKEMVSALEATTGMDMKIKSNAGRIVKVAKELREAGYSFQNVNQFGDLWQSDWRYKQNGTPPTLAVIKAEIGRTKNGTTPKDNQVNKFREKYKEQK